MEKESKYKKVVAVISKPPADRKDYEINNLVPWFRKQSKVFASLKTEIVFDVIKNLSFISRQRDDVLIREGDRGDCMYITLRGQCSIYRLNEDAKTVPAGQPGGPQTQNKTETIRQQLGDYIVQLARDAAFGDVALMSDDCIRSASVIVDEPSDFIVVDRELYDRSVKSVLKKEFEDKTNFIANCPYFNSWAPRYKKQLAMAMEKEFLPYDGTLTRQGDSVETIYFIASGEVKIIMDPQQHRLQYSKLLNYNDDGRVTPPSESIDNDESSNDFRPTLGIPKDATSTDLPMTSRSRKAAANRKQPMEVCLLGVNESIGDIEVLTGLSTYLQTAICTQRCEVLVLGVWHFERLFVKRHPKTVELMKNDLAFRLKPRMSSRKASTLPILKCLVLFSEEFAKQQIQQSEARHGSVDTKQTKHHRTIAEQFESFVPQRGALIDICGPGTVFYRIRQREDARLAKLQLLNKPYGATVGMNGKPQRVRMGRKPLITQKRKEPVPGEDIENLMEMAVASHYTDSEVSDPVLKNLEERMRVWLINKTPAGASIKDQPRVARLHRTQTDMDDVKLGAKVIIKPKITDIDVRNPIIDLLELDEDGFLKNGNAWVKVPQCFPSLKVPQQGYK